MTATQSLRKSADGFLETSGNSWVDLVNMLHGRGELWDNVRFHSKFPFTQNRHSLAFDREWHEVVEKWYVRAILEEGIVNQKIQSVGENLIEIFFRDLKAFDRKCRLIDGSRCGCS